MKSTLHKHRLTYNFLRRPRPPSRLKRKTNKITLIRAGILCSYFFTVFVRLFLFSKQTNVPQVIIVASRAICHVKAIADVTGTIYKILKILASVEKKVFEI